MFTALLGILGPIFGTVAKNLFPDPADELKRIDLQNQLQLEIMKQASAIELAAADIVKTEAQSEHWLAACWRPLLMLTFGGLIVARWLGWSAPGLSDAEVLKLWDIVQLGLGGYVIGRSVEKIAGPMASALSGKK
jgi:hypothetical protein